MNHKKTSVLRRETNGPLIYKRSIPTSRGDTLTSKSIPSKRFVPSSIYTFKVLTSASSRLRPVDVLICYNHVPELGPFPYFSSLSVFLFPFLLTLFSIILSSSFYLLFPISLMGVIPTLTWFTRISVETDINRWGPFYLREWSFGNEISRCLRT